MGLNKLVCGPHTFLLYPKLLFACLPYTVKKKKKKNPKKRLEVSQPESCRCYVPLALPWAHGQMKSPIRFIAMAKGSSTSKAT